LRVLEIFGSKASALLSEGGALIAEHHYKNQLPQRIGHMRRKRILKQGDSALSFYEAEDT
ncbi:MAG: hypothetical protein ACRD6N_03995, partial [Pyrinomonadaceae bacterium]